MHDKGGCRWIRSSVRPASVQLSRHDIAMSVERGPIVPSVTLDSPLLGHASTPAERAIHLIVRRGSLYTPHDIGVIVGYYWGIGPEAGLDPLLAIAQCIHETSAKQPHGGWWPLSSWWAQRPRRNPAGLGVTGEKRRDPPLDPTGWEWDEGSGLWRRGLRFASWVVATRAHLGRLLAYAITDAVATPVQQALIAEALALRPLPAHYRGVAPTLAGLNRRWAPSATYADKVVAHANAIINEPTS